MMRKCWLLCVLLGALAWGQAAPGTPPPQQPAQAPAAGAGKSEAPEAKANDNQESKEAKPAPAKPADTAASVPPDAAVITITGVCPAQPKPAAAKGTAAKPAAPAKAAAKMNPADCKTVITKAEFEKLADALAPNPPANAQLKKQLAGVLPRYMAMSAEAKKQGMEKNDKYKTTLKFVQMQILTNQLTQKVQKEAADVPDADIEKYYKDNPTAYEQYNLDRLFVPRTKTETEAKEENEEDEDKLTDEQKKAKEDAAKAKQDANAAAMTKLADDLRARAAAGEDIVKLQKEAFDAAGMKVESPTVNLPSVRRTGLPQGHVAVFDLKPGEISQVISDSGGHYIYKLNSKTEMALEQAKNEIHSKLQNDRTKERMDKLNGSFKAENNEAYFGPASAGPAPRGGMRPHMPPQPPAPSSQPKSEAPAQAPPAQAPAPKPD
jgi:chemotaxis protein histidine kinase CheA